MAHTFSLAAAGLVAMPASLFGQTAAHAAFHNVWEGTKIKEESKGHHCNNSGKDFLPYKFIFDMESSKVLDVLESYEGRRMIESVASSLKRDWLGMGENFAISTVVSQVTGLTNFVGSGIAMIYHTKAQKLLKAFAAEQVNYLQSHPSDIKKQLEINIIVSVRLLVRAFSLNDEAGMIASLGRMVFNSLINFSINKGIEEEAEKKFKESNRLKWQALSFPLSIVLNHYLTNQKIDRYCAEEWVIQILKFGKEANGYDELCFEYWTSILNSKIIDYDLGYLRSYNSYYGSSFPSLRKIIEMTESDSEFFSKLKSEHN